MILHIFQSFWIFLQSISWFFFPPKYSAFKLFVCFFLYPKFIVTTKLLHYQATINASEKLLLRICNISSPLNVLFYIIHIDSRITESFYHCYTISSHVILILLWANKSGKKCILTIKSFLNETVKILCYCKSYYLLSVDNTKQCLKQEFHI